MPTETEKGEKKPKTGPDGPDADMLAIEAAHKQDNDACHIVTASDNQWVSRLGELQTARQRRFCAVIKQVLLLGLGNDEDEKERDKKVLEWLNRPITLKCALEGYTPRDAVGSQSATDQLLAIIARYGKEVF